MEGALRSDPRLYAAYTHGRIESRKEIDALEHDLARLRGLAQAFLDADDETETSFAKMSHRSGWIATRAALRSALSPTTTPHA